MHGDGGSLNQSGPTLEEIGTRFRVTLWLGQVGAPTLDKTEETILAILSDGTGRVTSEVAKVIGLTARHAHAHGSTGGT